MVRAHTLRREAPSQRRLFMESPLSSALSLIHLRTYSSSEHTRTISCSRARMAQRNYFFGIAVNSVLRAQLASPIAQRWDMN